MMKGEIVKAKPTRLDYRMDSAKYIRIFRLEPKQARHNLRMIIQKLYLYRGQHIDSDQIAFMADALYNELMNDTKVGMKNFCCEEIWDVLKEDVLKNDSFLSVSSMYKTLYGYCTNEGHTLQKEAEFRKRTEMIEARRAALAPVESQMDAAAKSLAAAWISK